jgi:hypothetical protein
MAGIHLKLGYQVTVMIRVATVVKTAFCTGALLLTACAAIELTPVPDGHPANPQARSAVLTPSVTLSDPEPIDPRPARSEHWAGQPNAHDEHMHKDGTGDQDMGSDDAYNHEHNHEHHPGAH